MTEDELQADANAIIEAARAVPPNDLDHRTADELVFDDLDEDELEDDETEEVLRDVIVAQTMQWADRGADPTDLAGVMKAIGDLRAWLAHHEEQAAAYELHTTQATFALTNCGICDRPGHDDTDCPS